MLQIMSIIHSFVLTSTLFLCLFLDSTLTQGAGNAKLVFEDGYSVITVFDGDKSNIKVNPHSIHSHSNHRFILLDSVSSSFYSLSLPTTASSNETSLEKLVGNGESNYIDGDLGTARFNKPRSFAVDYKGNVYVADHRNHAIRMITKSGVSTIAGGRSQKPGRADGSDATFSDDFELTFVPERCALIISDHGNRLIRQINLKAENCKVASGSVLGTTSSWILGLAVSCIIGLIIGLVMRPYIIPYEGRKYLQFNGTWKHYLTNQERPIATFCSGIRNAVVKSKAYLLYLLSYRIVILSLSHLSLMFKFRNVELSTNPKQSVSLLDSDIVDSNNILIPPKVHDDLKSLMTFDGGSILLETSENVVEEEEKENAHVSRGVLSNVDSMIQANLIDFEEQSARVCSTESLDCTSGLIKRRRGVAPFPSST